MTNLTEEFLGEFQDLGAAGDAGDIATSVVTGLLSTASDVAQRATGRKVEPASIKLEHDVMMNKYLPWVIGGSLLLAVVALTRKK